MTSSASPVDVPDLSTVLIEHASYAVDLTIDEDPAPSDRPRRPLPVRAFRAYRGQFMIGPEKSAGLALVMLLGMIVSTMFVGIELLSVSVGGTELLPAVAVLMAQFLFFWVPALMWGEKVSENRRRAAASSVDIARAYANPPSRFELFAIRCFAFWIAFWSPAPKF